MKIKKYKHISIIDDFKSDLTRTIFIRRAFSAGSNRKVYFPDVIPGHTRY